MQNTVNTVNTTAATSLRALNMKKGATQSAGIKIKNAKNTSTKSRESFSARLSIEKIEPAENKETIAAAIRLRQISSASRVPFEVLR